MSIDHIGVVSRRRALRAIAGAAVAVAGCRRAVPHFACSSTGDMTPTDAAARTTLGYTDRASAPERACSACNHFVSAGESACGTCRIVRGPIHPSGSCRVWVARG